MHLVPFSLSPREIDLQGEVVQKDVLAGMKAQLGGLGWVYGEVG